MNKTVVAFMIASLAASTLAPGQQKRTPTPATAHHVVDQAIAALKEGDETRAVRLYDQARGMKDFASARPTPALVFAAGDAHVSLGTPEGMEQALSIYATALTLPDSHSADRALSRLKRAEVLLRQDKPREAREEVAAIRAISSRRELQLMADLGEANVQLHLGQAEVARDRLLPLADLDDPELAPMALFSLGRAYVQLKQQDQAVAVFRRLWNQYGETPYVKRAVFLVGGIYLDRGDFLEARKLFEACSVIGALQQKRVQPGEDLVVKVSDAHFFARTRSKRMPVTLKVASGDRETISLDKNPVSDVLYTGRVTTAYASAAAVKNDGILQVRGGDEVELTYEGQLAPARKVMVVEDGRINIDSVPLPPPPPRGRKPAPPPRGRESPDAVRPIVPGGRQASGTLNPGSPVYLQVIDADLDRSDQADMMRVEVLARGSHGESKPVQATLQETGPHTGVFEGSISTAQAPPTIYASSELSDHPASAAMDLDPAHPTWWKGKPREKEYWIEVDLREPAFLGKLSWSSGNDPAAAKNAPVNMSIAIRGDGVEKTITANAADHSADLAGIFARTVRFEIAKWHGDAPALGQIRIASTQGTQLVPAGIDPDEHARKGILEFDVGQSVFGQYLDEVNQTPGVPQVRISRPLGAGYHDAVLHLARRSMPQGERAPSFVPLWRLDLSAEPSLVISDPDLDTTIKPDTLTATVFSEAGSRRTLELTETGPATGLFWAVLGVTNNPAARQDPRLFFVAPGDLVWAEYMDQRNLRPGYRTFRHLAVLENQPTAGTFLPIPLLQSAHPFQLSPGAAEASADKPAAQEHLSIGVSDPDALAQAGSAVSIKVSALLSGAGGEFPLNAASAGTAGRPLSLILGDKDAQDAGENAKDELSVAGDDIIRLAYTDAKVATADVQSRRVLSTEELKAREKAPRIEGALPIVRLRDPQRRAQARQDARVAQLKTEMNQRLWGYDQEIKALTLRRQTLQARLSAAKAAAGDVERLSAREAIKGQVAALDAQIETLNTRIQRLGAMGAVPAPPMEPKPAQSAAPASELDRARLIADGPLTPGEPFDVLIEDPDLTAPQTDLRLRSVAGRLVQKLIVKAQRRPEGTYVARIATTRGEDDPARLSLVPGGEVIIDYTDAAQTAPAQVERVTYLALASDATLQALDPNYSQPIAQTRLGETIHIQITDYDQDRSPGQDRIVVTARSEHNDLVRVICTETEAHSGMFRGSFATTSGKADPADDLLQADYGGYVELSYLDALRLSAGSEPVKTLRLPISGGADGAVEAFSRQFRDQKEEMRLWYRTGQAAYELGRNLYLNGSTQRAQENLAEAQDYFTQLANRYPQDPLAASSSYYLGNILFLKGEHHAALERFQEVITRWPASEFVARARFKVGQCYEALGQFEQAADAYVLLTYHHPDDPNVPAAMIRMMNHYARSRDWGDAVAIAQKFVDRFPQHELAGQVALKAGQWLAVADKQSDALAWFVKAEKIFAARNKDMPPLLYWHAATLISGNRGALPGNAPRAEKIRELLNRVVYDYPGNEFVPLAKIALEQLKEKNQ